MSTMTISGHLRGSQMPLLPTSLGCPGLASGDGYAALDFGQRLVYKWICSVMALEEQPQGNAEDEGDALQKAAIFNKLLKLFPGGAPFFGGNGSAPAGSSADGQERGSGVNEQRRNENESTEGRLEEERISPGIAPTLPLKHDGRRIDVRRALVRMYSLQALLDGDPQHFEALLGLARNETKVYSEDSIDYLKRRGCLAADGTILPDVRDVLLSGYQAVGDGHHVGYPLRLEGQADRLIVQEVAEQIQQQANKIQDQLKDRGWSL